MPSAEEQGVRTIRPARWYYDNMPKEQRRCRGKRLHDFRDVDPDDEEPIHPTIRITGLGRSKYLITKACARGCGLVRVEYHIWQRRHFVLIRKPGYIRPDDWMVVPRGVLTATMIRQITMDRAHDLIAENAERPAEIPA